MTKQMKNRIKHKLSTNPGGTKMATAQNESSHRVTTTASQLSGEDRIRAPRLFATSSEVAIYG